MELACNKFQILIQLIIASGISGVMILCSYGGTLESLQTEQSLTFLLTNYTPHCGGASHVKTKAGYPNCR